MLISIVDRSRYGLLEHAEALNFFYSKATGKNSYILKNPKLVSNSHINFSIFKLLKCLIRDKPLTCVIWSVGITYLFLPVISFLFNKTKFIIVFHEPGGLRQRLTKGDGIFYSITVTLYEYLIKFSFVSIVTPNYKNSIKYNIKYAPLLFIFRQSFDKDNDNGKKSVIFLGRKDINRSYNLFSGNSLTNFLKLGNYSFNFNFFPSKGLYTTKDKENIMSDAICVLNLYLVNHNQSGVTPDSLSFGVPVIVTEKDAYADLIIKFNAGIVIDSSCIDHNTVLASINELINKLPTYRTGAKVLFENEFGFKAFKKHWLKNLL